MDIVINPQSQTPIYQQIYSQISAQIVRGELAGDSALPPIRTVARELKISVITIKKAWEELEHQGFIYTVTGKGCFVTPLSLEKRADLREHLVTGLLQKDIVSCRELGLDLDTIIGTVTKLYAEAE